MAPGDKVKLKSGGEIMMLAWIQDGKGQCYWLDKNNQIQGILIPLVCLIKVN